MKFTDYSTLNIGDTTITPVKFIKIHFTEGILGGFADMVWRKNYLRFHVFSNQDRAHWQMKNHYREERSTFQLFHIADIRKLRSLEEPEHFFDMDLLFAETE